MSGAVPRWWPERVYYGWALVGALGLTATVSYGILSYALAAFIAPMGAELGWSKTAITGAFSVAQLVAGIAAIPVGRWVDRHGARALMTAGSLLAAALLALWSRVESLTAFYLLQGAMGVALAAVLYEPAFAVIAVWFRRDRSRALTALTFIGGFASVIFVPLATVLVDRLGWRSALVAHAAIVLALTAVPHLLVLRRRPSDLGLAPDGEAAEPPRDDPAGGAGAACDAAAGTDARAAVRTSAFRWTALAFALSALATTAVSVHLVPLLVERGHDLTFAGAAMGVLGLMALPGRLVFTPLGDRWPRAAVTALIFALQAIALVVLLVGRGAASVWAFALLFGAGFGAITPARAALVAELFGARHYGRIGGTLALVVSLARAAAPVGASVLYAAAPAGRGYDLVLLALAALCVGSGAAVLLTDHGRASARGAIGAAGAPLAAARRGG